MVILHALLSSADFFQNQLFLKNSFRTTIRESNSLYPDQARYLSGLIWVQIVCKGYQQRTQVGKEFSVRVQMRPDVLSGLIWAQIICKGYQQR